MDGEVVRAPRQKVSIEVALSLDGTQLGTPPETVLWHKPVGVLCTLQDPWNRSTLWTEAEELLAWGLRPVGRLDQDTSGLLLLTTDGQVTQRLLHPKRQVPRTYRARVEGIPGPSLQEALALGVQTAEGTFRAEGVKIEGSDVTLTVREGKHRMVRRMLANAGHPVVDLRRLAFGAFELGELPQRSWREPTESEVSWLHTLKLPTP